MPIGFYSYMIGNMDNKNSIPHIVIMGLGFGGVYAYLKLHNLFHAKKQVRITIISERDHFMFTPMIHEVATGTLLSSSLRQPARTLPQCCIYRFVEGIIGGINCDTKTVTVHHMNPYAPEVKNSEGAEPTEEVPYDYLISALGSEVNFFGTPGAAEYALTLKDIDDAERLKNRIIESFEEAELAKTEEEKKRLLHFIIVGGGPTGVELAGEMADLINKEMKDAFPSLCDMARVSIYEGGSRLMGAVDEWFAKHAADILADKKVSISYNMRITNIYGTGVSVGEEQIEAGTVIWTAGVRARDLIVTAMKDVLRDERSNRIKVNEFMQIPAYPNVFVAGDQAYVVDKEAGQPYPMRAQFAVREGVVAAKNIKNIITKEAPLEEFSWRDKGFIVSLGKGGALAEAFGMRWGGTVAWIVYRGAYLMKIVGVRAKLRTTLEWILNFFLPRDISKL